MKKTFVVYKDRKSYTKFMTVEEKAEFLDALFFYQTEEGEYIHKYSSVRVVFGKILEVFNEDKIKREKTRELRSELGKRGGLAKASKSYQKLAKARNDKLPSNSNIVYLRYTNIENLKNSLISILGNEFCLGHKNLLYVLIDMVELGYSVEEKKESIISLLDRMKEVLDKYQIDEETFKQKILAWKTRHQTNGITPKNYKNSIYTFLQDKGKQKK